MSCRREKETRALSACRKGRGSEVAVVTTGVKSEIARYGDDTRARWQFRMRSVLLMRARWWVESR